MNFSFVRRKLQFIRGKTRVSCRETFSKQRCLFFKASEQSENSPFRMGETYLLVFLYLWASSNPRKRANFEVLIIDSRTGRGKLFSHVV